MIAFLRWCLVGAVLWVAFGGALYLIVAAQDRRRLRRW